MPTPSGHEPAVGTVVQDRQWGGTHTGIVVRREGSAVFVAWQGSCVEDELDIDQVDLVPDPTDEQRSWRGGIGIMDADGTSSVRGLGDSG